MNYGRTPTETLDLDELMIKGAFIIFGVAGSSLASFSSSSICTWWCKSLCRSGPISIPWLVEMISQKTIGHGNQDPIVHLQSVIELFQVCVLENKQTTKKQKPWSHNIPKHTYCRVVRKPGMDGDAVSFILTLLSVKTSVCVMINC